MNIKKCIRNGLLKCLGLEDIDEYVKRQELRVTDLESSCDDFEIRIHSLEHNEILSFDSGDFVASNDYDYKIDDIETRIGSLEDHEILDYDSDDFIYNTTYDSDREELLRTIDRLTKALQAVASKVDLEIRIDEILEGAQDE